MLPKLVSTIFTYLNAGGYYKTALEIKNAINTSQIQLYKKLRGNLADYGPSRAKSNINFQETTVSNDSLSELYRVFTIPYTGNIVTIAPQTTRIIDVVQSLEIQYTVRGDYYPVNIVPDNQFLLMQQNKVLYPPTATVPSPRPIGRLESILAYEVYPSVFNQSKVRVLTLPQDVNFDLVDDPLYEVPQVAPNYIDTDFTEEKFNNLLFLTIESLGFNLSNGVLIQAGAQKQYKEL